MKSKTGAISGSTKWTLVQTKNFKKKEIGKEIKEQQEEDAKKAKLQREKDGCLKKV